MIIEKQQVNIKTGEIPETKLHGEEGSRMSYSKARCPYCNHLIEVNTNDIEGFCMDCGKNIIVAEVIAGYKNEKVSRLEGLIFAATQALTEKDGVEAMKFIDEALNLEPELPEAWICKMQATNVSARLDDLKIEEVITYGNNAIKYAETEKKQDVTDIVYHILLNRAEQLLDDAIVLYNETDEIKKKYDSGVGTNACLQADSLLMQRLTSVKSAALKLKKAVPAKVIEESEEYHALVKSVTIAYLESEEAKICRLEIYKAKMESFLLEMRENDLKEFSEGLSEVRDLEPKLRNTCWADSNGNNSLAGGCYIATAVYGNYRAPEVMVLRRYRDEVLAKSIVGRMFIKLYYLLSPTVAKWLKDTKRWNLFVKNLLDKWVEHLRKETL